MHNTREFTHPDQQIESRRQCVAWAGIRHAHLVPQLVGLVMREDQFVHGNAPSVVGERDGGRRPLRDPERA